MKMKKPSVRRVVLIVGIGLLAVAAAVLILWQWGIHTAATEAKEYVQTIRSLIPEPQSAVPEQRRDNTMATLSVDETNFVGILEMPSYDAALPVCADWGEVSQYPCRFGGSIYDGSLCIGTTSQSGQYDFYREISVGDLVYFTDMEGNRYTFTVTNLRYAKHADRESLQSGESALTVFVKNIYALEYLIVNCDVLQ